MNMYKTIFGFSVILLLSACSSIPAIDTTKPKIIGTATLSPITVTPLPPTALPTSSPRVNQTPTPYPSRTPTPIPKVVWSNEFPPPVQLDNFEGVWSPKTNTIAGVMSESDLRTGDLVFAQSPNFSAQIVDSEHSDRIAPKITWSPDGSQIVYGVSYKASSIDDISINIVGEMWMLATDTHETRNTGFIFPRGLSFWGWMDDKTVVFDTYTGGGHIDIAGWNYETGKILISDKLPYYSFGTFRFPYAAMNGWETTPLRAFVMVPNVTPIPGDPPCMVACRSKKFSLEEPALLDPFSVNSLFQTWHPDSDQVLIAVYYSSDEEPQAGLFLWDIVTDKYTPVQPGALYGAYSPDGRIFVWTSYGAPSGLNLNNNSTGLSRIDIQQPVYLNFTDRATTKLVLSLPIFSHWWEDFSLDSFLMPYYTFSPDGRWATVLTAGIEPLQDGNWIFEQTEIDAGKLYLQVIDLKNGQVISSTPVKGKPSYQDFQPVWSPVSDRFVYQDETGNWRIFDTAAGLEKIITRTNGEIIGHPAWSYDGRYIQFTSSSLYSFSDNDLPRFTAIIDITDN